MTDIDELNRWETTEAHLDLRPGGDFLYVFAYGPPRPGTFLAVEAPRRMVQVSMVFNRDRSFRYINSNTLRAEAGGTRLDVVVEGFVNADAVERWLCESMDLGWEGDLQCLKTWVEEGRDARPDIWPGLHMGVAYVSEPGGGIRLLEVFAGAPADASGLRPGDVVVTLEDRRVTDFRGFRARLGEFEIGDTVGIEAIRDGEAFTTQLTFGDALVAPAQ